MTENETQVPEIGDSCAAPGSSNRPTKDFICSYHHDGGEWSLMLRAYDFADAESRVKKLGYLRLDGEVMATIPVKFGWFAKAIVRVRNFFR